MGLPKYKRESPFKPNANDKKLFNSSLWQRFRKVILTKTPFCPCGALAVDVHHKKRRRDFPELTFVEDNVEALCKSCHSKKTICEEY